MPQARAEILCFVPSCYIALAEQAFENTTINGVRRTVIQSRQAYTGEVSAEMTSSLAAAGFCRPF